VLLSRPIKGKSLMAYSDVEFYCKKSTCENYDPVLDLWIENFSDHEYCNVVKIHAHVTIEK
jgi:hypothetical protein